MPEKTQVRLEWPAGGRVDRFAYQQQPQNTTIASRNVWPKAMNRDRGGSRPGFTKYTADALGGKVLAIGTVTFIPDASSRIQSSVVAIDSAGTLFIEDGGVWTTIDTIHVEPEIFTVCERNQKLYIAVNSIVAANNNLNVKPYVFDPVAGTVGYLTATAGSVPLGCPSICTWRDRIVLAGGVMNPYGVFMSRQGDPTDWDYSVIDAAGAVTLGPGFAGQMADTVTSLCPHADNCLIIGCPTSLWLLQGDPRDGGQMANLSMTIGVVGPTSWCTTPDGWFVFMSADGLYAVPAGCSSTGNPQSLSREKLPVELLGINRDSTTAGTVCSLAYDVRWRGVHIFVTKRADSTGTPEGTDVSPGDQHWFFDWDTKSFWPVQYGNAGFDPWCCTSIKNTVGSESLVVCGCRDGKVRCYKSTATKDDEGYTTERKIDSYVTLGPLSDDPSLSNDLRIDELDIILASGSGWVDWKLYRGDSSEEAAGNVTDGQEACSGVASAGRQQRCYPRVRGASLYLKLSSVTAWAFEAVVAMLSRTGRTRV